MDKNFDVVIEPQYDYALNFVNGLGSVLKNNLWGYINEKNEIIIDFQFSKAYGFFNELANVNIGNKSDCIDRSGRSVFDFKYKSVHPVSGTELLLILGSGKRMGYASKNGTEYWED